MKLLLPLILIASAPFQIEPAETYLLSVVDVPLTANESIEKFTLSTWGVTFSAVCEIPSGWTIRAGGSLTPEGVLEGPKAASEFHGLRRPVPLNYGRLSS
jgi:hypothetical protein